MDLPKELIEKFKVVSEQRMGELNDVLALLIEDCENKILYDKAYQIFHKYHGAASMYGFATIGELAGVVEEKLMNVIARNELLEDADVRLIARARDLISKAIHEDGDVEDEVKNIMQELKGNVD